MYKYLIGFAVGMLFMNSLTGEYAKYGLEIAQQIEKCEEEGKECNYSISEIVSSSYHALGETF